MNDTVAAKLTGSGRGAVATVAIRGPASLNTVMRLFKPATKSVAEPTTNRIYFGTWVWQSYEEDLVICRVDDECVEIHCHGGNMAAGKILESFAASNVTVVSADQWQARFQQDRFVREALHVLPLAKTNRAVAIVLDQSRHAMRKTLTAIQTDLRTEDPQRAIDRLNLSISFGAWGTRIEKPFRIVLVGMPNSGKSSLVNAIVGYERTITYDQPGTTRDSVFAETALHGWAVVLTDTAGIRSTFDPVERTGIEIATTLSKTADLILHVSDLSKCESSQVEMNGFEFEEHRTIRVGTKSDLKTGTMAPTMDVETSAIKGDGIDELGERIIQHLVPQLPVAGTGVPLSPWQLANLMTLLALVEASKHEEALRMLSELLGENG